MSQLLNESDRTKAQNFLDDLVEVCAKHNFHFSTESNFVVAYGMTRDTGAFFVDLKVTPEYAQFFTSDEKGEAIHSSG